MTKVAYGIISKGFVSSLLDERIQNNPRWFSALKGNALIISRVELFEAFWAISIWT